MQTSNKKKIILKGIYGQLNWTLTETTISTSDNLPNLLMIKDTKDSVDWSSVTVTAARNSNAAVLSSLEPYNAPSPRIEFTTRSLLSSINCRKGSICLKYHKAEMSSQPCSNEYIYNIVVLHHELTFFLNMSNQKNRIT